MINFMLSPINFHLQIIFNLDLKNSDAKEVTVDLDIFL